VASAARCGGMTMGVVEALKPVAPVRAEGAGGGRRAGRHALSRPKMAAFAAPKLPNPPGLRHYAQRLRAQSRKCCAPHKRLLSRRSISLGQVHPLSVFDRRHTNQFAELSAKGFRRSEATGLRYIGQGNGGILKQFGSAEHALGSKPLHGCHC